MKIKLTPKQWEILERMENGTRCDVRNGLMMLCRGVTSPVEKMDESVVIQMAEAGVLAWMEPEVFGKTTLRISPAAARYYSARLRPPPQGGEDGTHGSPLAGGAGIRTVVACERFAGED